MVFRIHGLAIWHHVQNRYNHTGKTIGYALKVCEGTWTNRLPCVYSGTVTLPVTWIRRLVIGQAVWFVRRAVANQQRGKQCDETTYTLYTLLVNSNITQRNEPIGIHAGFDLKISVWIIYIIFLVAFLKWWKELPHAWQDAILFPVFV